MHVDQVYVRDVRSFAKDVMRREVGPTSCVTLLREARGSTSICVCVCELVAREILTGAFPVG